MSGCFLFKVPGNPDSVASSVNEKGLPERQSFFHFEISSGLDSHWDEPLQEKQLQSRARSSAKLRKRKKLTQESALFSRSRADSNRCRSFCRAQPSHSATRPINSKLEIQN